MDSVNAHQQTEGSYFDDVEPDLQLFASRHSVHFPLPDSDSLKEKIKRFLLLLTVNDSAMDIPKNLDARRRMHASQIHNFFKVTSLATKELNADQDSVSIGFYMQKIFPDELNNFLERMKVELLEDLDLYFTWVKSVESR
ncbi:hypothetical protein Tco_0849550 [Tanacetum coccineum]